MYQQTPAEFFIKTLEELRDAERECRIAQLRLQHKAHAVRFMNAFRTEFEHSGRPSEWTLRSQQMSEEDVWHLLGE